MSAAIVEMTMPMPTPSANPNRLLMERTTMAALYAPMHINPACPSENCPQTPMIRFSETARMMLMQMLYSVI